MKIIRRIASFAPTNWLRCLIFRLGEVKIGRATYIAWGSTIGNNVIIGKSAKINKNCNIGENVKIGDSVIIGSDTHIANSSIGNRSFIESGVIFTGFKEGKIKIGETSYVGIRSVLDWSGNIEIGNYVHIAGPSVGIWTHTSVFQALSGDKLTDHHRKKVAQVKIEDYVYIGGNSTIYPGVKISHHSVILPNTAIDKDVDEYTMVGGGAAEEVRKIKITEDEIKFIKIT